VSGTIRGSISIGEAERIDRSNWLRTIRFSRASVPSLLALFLDSEGSDMLAEDEFDSRRNADCCADLSKLRKTKVF
jgi:hypothetical protein